VNPFQFRRQLAETPGGTNAGDGIRRTVDIKLADIKTTAGLTLTAATVPTIANVETNAIGIVAAASGTASGSFTFIVPKDYDKVNDELKINVVANSAGNTDSPTLTATAYRKRTLTALTAALTAVASSAVPKSASPAAIADERTIDLSGNSLLPGDVLTINLVAGAHTTDALNIYSVEMQYKGDIVFNTVASR
jgi:hypothetical protein